MATNLLTIPRIRHWLAQPEVFDLIYKLAEKHGTPADRAEEFLDLTDAVVKGNLAPDQMPAMLSQAFGLEEEQAQALAADLAGHRLLPLMDFLPKVPDLIVNWGGKVEDYPKDRITAEQEITQDAASRILERYGIELPPELLKRFQYLVKGYISKARSEEATLTFLKRPANIGGLEMSEEAAQNLLSELKTERAAVEAAQASKEEDHPEVVKVMQDGAAAKNQIDRQKEHEQDLEDITMVQRLHAREEPLEDSGTPEQKGVSLHNDTVTPPPALAPGAPLAVQVPPPTPKPEPVVETVVEPKTEEVIFEPVPVVEPKEVPVEPEVEEEIPVVSVAESQPEPESETVAEPEELLPVPATSHALTKEVPVISGDLINHEEMQDVEKAKRQLQRSGGDAWDPLADIRVQEALEEASSVFAHKQLEDGAFNDVANAHVRGLRDPLKTEQLLKDKYGFSTEDVLAVMPSFEKARALAQGYKGRPGEISPAKKPIEEKDVHAKKEAEVLNKRHAALTRSIHEESATSVAPTARVSAARSKEEELDLQEKGIDESRVAEAKQLSRPKKAKAMISKPTAPAPTVQKKVTDVVYRQRLVGPVQELGGMTPADFRRISSDPAAATRRILDKLALLESTSYEERVRGVKAWRSSPINKLYVEMARQALMKGVSIQEIATERRNSGEESLSPAEIQALLKLNTQLKF